MAFKNKLLYGLVFFFLSFPWSPFGPGELPDPAGNPSPGAASTGAVTGFGPVKGGGRGLAGRCGGLGNSLVPAL